MKYALRFRTETPLQLPVNYNKILQAAILNWLQNQEATVFLHDVGYEHHHRKYKLYTFSDIRGEYRYLEKIRRIEYLDEFYIFLSFYSDDYEWIVNDNVKNKKPIVFGTNVVPLIDAMVADEVYQSCIVDTASPITVHSTFEKQDGRKITHYYEPTEKGFSEMVRNNLIRKYVSYHGVEPESADFSIKPYNCKKLRRIDTSYDRIVIRAWRGSYEIDGSPELIKMALLAGIGERNAIGFGCVLQRKSSVG